MEGMSRGNNSWVSRSCACIYSKCPSIYIYTLQFPRSQCRYNKGRRGTKPSQLRGQTPNPRNENKARQFRKRGRHRIRDGVLTPDVFGVDARVGHVAIHEPPVGLEHALQPFPLLGTWMHSSKEPRRRPLEKHLH
jgi:hypothetical protein